MAEKPEIEIPIERKLANFEMVAEEWLKEKGSCGDVPDQFIKAFAKHLDSFTTLDDKMKLLAIETTLKVYMEFYDILKNKLDPKVFAECIALLQKKHKH